MIFLQVVNVSGSKEPLTLFCIAHRPRVASLRPQQILDCSCDVCAPQFRNMAMFRESFEASSVLSGVFRCLPGVFRDVVFRLRFCLSDLYTPEVHPL